MTGLHFFLPGDIATRTGGYLYDKRITEGLEQLPKAAWRVRLHALADSFPLPDRAAIDDARNIFAALPTGAITIIDGLALAALHDILAEQRQRLRLIALIHHPLADETDLSEAQRRCLHEQEKRALNQVERVIVTSPFTARELSHYGVEHKRITVVLPGTEPPTRPLKPKDDTAEPVLLCVATLIPRKGHRLLIEALSGLQDRPWRLVCVGNPTRSPATAAEIAKLIDDTGLGDRVEVRGELADAALEDSYREADIFVLPSYHEGYGMALAEALIYGLPIVSTTAGAIPDTVPGEAGYLVAPGNSEALRAALAGLLDDPHERRRCARAAYRAGRKLPNWDQSVRDFAAVLANLSPDKNNRYEQF